MSIAEKIASIETHIDDAYDMLELGGAKIYKLPKEYTQVDYIESTGTQYIDTGFKPNQDTNIIIDADYSPSRAQLLLGTRRLSFSQNVNALILGRMSNSSTFLSVYYGSQLYIIEKTESTGRKIFQINKEKFYIDNVLENTFESTSYQATDNLTLFALNTAGTVSFNSSAKIYSCKIYDNNVLVRDYIPCKRDSDNEIGLYDLVNNTFTTNAGTGVFTYGNVSRETIINKNIDNIDSELKKRYIDFMNNGTDEVWNNWEKVTGTGENVTLNNTVQAPMELGVGGNTSQQTYTGKNKFNKNASSLSVSATASAIDTGVRATDTGSSSGVHYAVYRTVLDLVGLEGKTIRLKSEWVASASNNGRFCMAVGKASVISDDVVANTTTSGTTLSYIVPNELDEEKHYLQVRLYSNGSGTVASGDYVDYNNLIVTINNSDMSYEPYVRRNSKSKFTIPTNNT